MKKLFGAALAITGVSIISIAADLPVEQTLKFGLGLFVGGSLMIIGWIMI